LTKSLHSPQPQTGDLRTTWQSWNYRTRPSDISDARRNDRGEVEDALRQSRLY